MRLVHLACPQCGAKLQLTHPNMEWVPCQYCSSTFYVQRDRAQAPPMGHPTVYYPPPTTNLAPIMTVVGGIIALSVVASVIGVVATRGSSALSSSKLGFAQPSSAWIAPGPPLLTDVNGDGAEDAIMTPSNSATLVAYNGVTGDKLWTSDSLSRANFASPKMALFEDRVLVESERDLYAVDTKTGKQVWMSPLDARVKVFCALGPKHIQASLDDEQTFRVDLATGKLTAEARQAPKDRFTPAKIGKGGFLAKEEAKSNCSPIWTNETPSNEPLRLPRMVLSTDSSSSHFAFSPLPKVADANVAYGLLPVDGLQILLGFKNPGRVPIAVAMRGDKEVWRAPISPTETRGNGPVTMAALSHGRVLTVRDPKGPWKVTATDAASGKMLWETEVQGELGPWTSITTSDHVVFVRYGWSLHAFAFADGHQLYKLGK